MVAQYFINLSCVGAAFLMIGILTMYVQVGWMNYGSPEGKARVDNTLSWLILIGRGTILAATGAVVSYVLETH